MRSSIISLFDLKKKDGFFLWKSKMNNEKYFDEQCKDFGLIEEEGQFSKFCHEYSRQRKQGFSKDRAQIIAFDKIMVTECQF